MSNLPTLTVDLQMQTDTHSTLFFLKKVWKVTAKDIVEYKQAKWKIRLGGKDY
jgi:hypothetical protein